VIYVARKITAYDVLDRLAELYILRGIPDFVRSDNGPEFIAEILLTWLSDLGVRTLEIEPGSPWENGYIESFNGKLRDELLNREIFDTLLEARVLTERYRREYNTIRLPSALNYWPQAPEAWAFRSVTTVVGYATLNNN